MFNILRRVLPLKGHKSTGMRTCHRAYCECGWSSEAYWERSEAWSEYRNHLLSKGGEQESIEKARARHEREMKKAMSFTGARQ